MEHGNLANRLKRFSAVALSGIMLTGLMPSAFAEEPAQPGVEEIEVAADWKFGEEGVLSGTIGEGNLVIADQSGNGNSLTMQTYGEGDWNDYIQFSADSMNGDGGSMVFDGDSANRVGADFITVDDAPINKEEFRSGYTMEFLYYFPQDWTDADRWMSIIGRQGASGSISEPEQGSMFTAVSNCKEIQFVTANADDSHTMSSAAWSVSMDEGGVWYHIAIVSDGHEISTYVNGCEAFRDYVSDEMVGMYADPADGRFRIGSSWWEGIDKFLQGSLQEVRICAEPLEKEDWLIPNPEDHIGEYGRNDSYQLKNEDNYNIVLIPDTQNTIEYRPDVMNAAIDGLIDSADELNVKGVIHLGDVVDDNNDDQQYINARDAFYRLPDAGIKFLVQLGNHDGWSGGIHNYYNSFSGKSTAFTRKTSWYLTNSPNGDGNSSYMFVNGGSYNYLVVSLSCSGSGSGANNNTGWYTEDEEWLRSVLEEYPNCPTIVTTHDLQNCSDTEPSAIKLSGRGQQLWNIVKDYDQVFMLVGGHSHGSGVQELTNTNGKSVISILTDYQFAYNGGNGFFRYLEFDESADKIYYSTYSPYAANLPDSEKSFFDVNFMTGEGNEGEIDLSFEERFDGMKAPQIAEETEGKWMNGEYHTHTGQSKDATSEFMSLKNVLAAAFRNADVLTNEENSQARFENIKYGDEFDFLGLADHLRKSYNGTDGQGNGKYDTAFYVAVQTQMREIEKLRVKGIYNDKIISSGFEWDMPGLDHASVGILDENGNESIDGIHEFEWKYASQGGGDDPTELFTLGDKADDMDEQAVYGDRLHNGQAETAYDAAAWVEENYPGSYILPNHPSRHNGGSGEVKIENLRRLNDAAPNTVFGFEGMPGNQMSGSGRCELPPSAIRNGADEMIAITGGVWDAMLSEGRRFYNFANSDFHFKVSTDEKYSSGYWASEYSTNRVWVEPGDDNKFDYSDVVNGLRSGNSYAVYGNLISDLEFTVSSADGTIAVMGGDVEVSKNSDVTVTIRFRSGENNNYETLFGTDTGIEVDNVPDLDHVDLIMGHVTGIADDYTGTENTDAKIVKTFSKEELASALGEDGYYTLTYTAPADNDLYFRLRGTSVSQVDENGDPLSDADNSSIKDNYTRFDTVNDSNYNSLCFYANPIWVNVDENGFEADSLSIQPGETTSSVNMTWYAPGGTTEATVEYNGKTAKAVVSPLHTPTTGTNPYGDAVVCKATLSGLEPATAYTYKISNDGGKSFSKEYVYTTPSADSFTFAFTSDPQIKENGSTDGKGWNPSDGTNQTGWAVMMETAAEKGATLMVSAGDQVEDQSWGKKSEYDAFFAPEEMSSIAYAPAVGNHDRHYMFADHFNLPNEMTVGEDGLTEVYTTFRGQNSGSSLSHGNYTKATDQEIADNKNEKGVTPNADGRFDYPERREMETRGNYYYLYNNILFVTLNTGAYPGGNDAENNPENESNAEAEAIVANFRKTLESATEKYGRQYDWLIVAHHKSTQTVAKHTADSDIENYVDAGFEKLMDEFGVDFVLGGHDHVYSRSYVLKDGKRNAERLDTFYDPDGTIYLTGNCASDMQYYDVFDKLDKNNNADYPVLANGMTGSASYLEGKNTENKADYLPMGNQEYNQEFSPSYAIFSVNGGTISVKVYNLDGDSVKPDSREVDSFMVIKNADGGEKTEGFENKKASLKVTQTARYDAGMTNADGGVMEIVDYNSENGWAYAVNGQTGILAAIPVKTIEEKDTVDLLDGKNIDVKGIVEDDSFAYGDMTSVAVSPDGELLAAAIQADGYDDSGRAAIFKCNDDGTLTFIKTVETGVQPDMITFTPDGSKILTANEGEPREGYGDGAVDPMGSVTVIDVSTGEAVTVDFTDFDSEEERAKLTESGVVIKKNTLPSKDFEPEYIAASNETAYVTLQEANAVAVLDLKDNKFTGVYSLGFEDYSAVAVDIDKKDGAYDPKTYAGLKGIRMPDAIALYTAGDTDYIITANEGDSREWKDYLNETEVNFGKGKSSPRGNITPENSSLTGKVVFFDTSDYDGLDENTDYLFGGRSFTMYRFSDEGIEEIFTSGNDFEEKTAKYLPDYFNCSNDDLAIDDRSGKKGPEPETVTVGKVGSRTYAFVTLERIGGIMVYDITHPASASFVNYINSRDFTADVAADDSPEGLKFVPAKNSPTGKALLMAACEVGGTVAVYELSGKKTLGGSSTSSNTTNNDTDNNTDKPVVPDIGKDEKPKANFDDVTDKDWFSKAVDYVYKNGIMNGTGGKTFSPDVKLSRGMAAQILYNMEGKPGYKGGSFTDVTENNWYYDAVNWAAENGIVEGFGDGTFGGDEFVTREQLAAILYRYAKYKNYSVAGSGDLKSFTDRDKVSPWAEDALIWAVETGIISGKGGGILDPGGSATRAEAAQMIMNFCEKFRK